MVKDCVKALVAEPTEIVQHIVNGSTVLDGKQGLEDRACAAPGEMIALVQPKGGADVSLAAKASRYDITHVANRSSFGIQTAAGLPSRAAVFLWVDGVRQRRARRARRVPAPR